jgi:catechol 2,3-dioxygenase-like lactoylglutathione lyase family enzyme
VDDMPLRAVSHVSLTVTDLDRSRAWYTEVLGWTEQAQGRGETTIFACDARMIAGCAPAWS